MSASAMFNKMLDALRPGDSTKLKSGEIGTGGWVNVLREEKDASERQELIEKQREEQRREQELRPEYVKLSTYLRKFDIRELMEAMNSAYWNNAGDIRLIEGTGDTGGDAPRCRVIYTGYQLYHDYMGEEYRRLNSNSPFIAGELISFPMQKSLNVIIGAAKLERDEKSVYCQAGGPKIFLFIRHDDSKALPTYFQYGNRGWGGEKGIDSEIAIEDWEYGRQMLYPENEITKKLQTEAIGLKYWMTSSLLRDSRLIMLSRKSS